MRFKRHQDDHKTGKIVIKPKREIHREQRDWKCDICGKSLQNYSALKRHEVTHNEPDKKCSFCDKNFSDKSDLIKHEKTHTQSTKKIAECCFCEKKFPTTAILRIHI